MRGVLNWFNRRDIGIVNGFTATRSTASGTYVEVNTEIRGNFLTWADEAVLVGISGIISNNTASTGIETSIGFDGTAAEDAASRIDIPTATAAYPLALSLVKNGLAEGFHFTTLLGQVVSGGTASWTGGAAGNRVSLTVHIRG